MASRPDTPASDAGGAGGSKRELAGPADVKTSDVPSDLLEFATVTARQLVRQLQKGEVKNQWEVAERLSSALKERVEGTWHVLVGRSFGSFVTHEARTLMYFFVDGVAFLAFRHG